MSKLLSVIRVIYNSLRFKIKGIKCAGRCTSRYRNKYKVSNGGQDDIRLSFLCIG